MKTEQEKKIVNEEQPKIKKRVPLFEDMNVHHIPKEQYDKFVKKENDNEDLLKPLTK